MNDLSRQLRRQLDTYLRRQPTLGPGVYIARGATVLGDVTLGEKSSSARMGLLR